MPTKILTFYRIATATLGLVLLAIAAYMVRSLPESQNAAIAIPGDPAAGSIVDSMRPLMGTEFGIKVWAAAGREPVATAIIAEALDELTELESQISRQSGGLMDLKNITTNVCSFTNGNGELHTATQMTPCLTPCKKKRAPCAQPLDWCTALASRPCLPRRNERS